MVFVSVFIVSFMAADYFITGSVTNTWIAIAVMAGFLTGAIRLLVQGLAHMIQRIA